MTLELAVVFGKSLLFVLAAMLPILNPLATAPIFLGLTEGASSRTRTLLARRLAHNMFWMLSASMLIGSYVLDFFGISLPIVRIGGGLILTSMAWRLLGVTPNTPDSRVSLADAYTPEQARKQAFYPLTFPISCGPASIAVAITVGVSLHDNELIFSLARMTAAMLALCVIGVLMYLSFRYAAYVLRLLGDAGTAVFLRMSSFILLCLGVQIIWDGVSELLKSVLVVMP